MSKEQKQIKRRAPKKRTKRLSPANIFLALNLIFVAVIFLKGCDPGAFRQKITALDLASYNGQRITFTGRVCEEADNDYKSRRLTVCVKNKASGRSAGQALITTDLYPSYDYGDFIKISGELQAPPKIEGFDYENYLARYDIYSVMYYPKLSRTDGKLARPEKIYKILIFIKQKIKAVIDENLPEPEAGLADALLLGYHRTVIREDLDIFSRVGLSHMIAISGSHITILSAMIMNFFLALGLNRRRALKIIFVFLILYPLVTGLSASAVRSALMGGLAFWAVYNERSSSLIRALIFSAALMLAVNPRLLRDDIGFQLSFLALLGIIYIYPLTQRASDKLITKLKLDRRVGKFMKTIIETINLTLVSQIVILPIAIIDFKQLSLIAPVANVLVLWTFAPLLAALIIGIFIAALASVIGCPLLGVIGFFPSYVLLKFIFIVANWLAAPRWAAIPINGFNWFFGGVYYLILAIIIILLRNKKTANC